MASGYGNDAPAPRPHYAAPQLPKLQNGEDVSLPRPSSPAPTAATGAGQTDDRDNFGLPKLVGYNTFNPGPPKDEKEEADKRKRIMAMNQKVIIIINNCF